MNRRTMRGNGTFWNVLAYKRGRKCGGGKHEEKSIVAMSEEEEQTSPFFSPSSLSLSVSIFAS